MERLFLAFVCTLVHIPSIFIRFAPFRDIATKRQQFILWLVYTPILLCDGIIYYLMSDHDNLILHHKLMLIVMALILSAVNILVIPGHWREHCFTNALASIHVSVTYFIAAYVVMHFVHTDSQLMLVASSAALTFLLFLILVHFYCNSTRRVVAPFLNIDSGSYWKRIWYIPLGLFFASFFAAPLDTYSVSTVQLLCRFSILLTTILVSNAVSADHEQMLRRIEMAEQLNIHRDYYNGLTERLAEVRKTRHDFKHHMSAIRKYIDTDDKSGLTAYWEELQDVLSHELTIPYTGNAALDGVLYRYAALSQHHRVRFDFSGMVDRVQMPDTALCVLLGNALDNALAGCLTIKQNRFISVTARIDGHGQSLLIRNSYDGLVLSEEDRILSRKREHAPGVGLDSMRGICDQFGALMDIRYDENQFQVLLVIPTTE